MGFLVAVYYHYKLQKKLNVSELQLQFEGELEIYVDNNVDNPIPFGFKQTWIAIRTDDMDLLMKKINPENRVQKKTNWAKGLDAAYKGGYTFVSPRITEWILIINPPVGVDVTNNFSKIYLSKLSETFGEVQFFGNHRVSNYSEWAKFINGKLIRSFGVDDCELLSNEGVRTKVEDELYKESEMKLEEYGDEINEENITALMSGEEEVMRVAKAWSVSPIDLDHYNSEGLGWVIG